MELTVLDHAKSAEPWYGGGLRFTCAQCGNCCTGGPGYVWISAVEITRLAEHLKLTERQVISRYCRKVGSMYSLKEVRNERKEYDCIFLKEEKAATTKAGQQITMTRRSCSIYSVRPLQCRTWPFWESNLQSPAAWKNASERCHGMNNGRRVFDKEQIEAIRDAPDWPSKPPTSK